jgi:branched-chain amino acid aminotransferase
MVRAKASGNYMNSILANNEATTDGYDEALLLDPEGYVCEGAGENIFIVRNGKLYTPDLTACLEGITRATVIQLAGEWASKSSKSASPAMKSIAPTKPSSPAPPPK